MNNIAVVLEQIKSLTTMDLVELNKQLKILFGVTDSMLCGPQIATAPAAGGAVEPTEEKTTFDVVMMSCGESKVPVIKVVRDLTSLGLKEAKDLVEKEGSIIRTGVSKQEAEEVIKKLKEVGATCLIK
jgi:large subunit ribosomal protein L7/L12